nr:uncharacterized protein LOC108065185 [Drosophila takahashii]
MCQCDDPDFCCTMFFAIWSIVIGAISLASALLNLIDTWSYWPDFGKDAFESISAVLLLVLLIVSILYFCSGICMLMGIKRRSRKLFVCGKGLSYFFPIITFYMVFTIVVHFSCLPKVCRYMKRTWS